MGRGYVIGRLPFLIAMYKAGFACQTGKIDFSRLKQVSVKDDAQDVRRLSENRFESILRVVPQTSKRRLV